MSDTMLIGVLRMPVHDYGDLELIQFIGRAQDAADRIESDAVKIDQLRKLVEIALEDGALSGGTWEDNARAALKATEEG